MTGAELLKTWYERVWVDADTNAVVELLDTDALASGLFPDFAAQLEDFQTLVPSVLREVRDVEVHMLDSMEEGDKAWARVRLAAKRAEDMKPISIEGQVVIRHKNNKILEAHNNFDFLAYFEQMGNLPQDAVALCLAGEVLQ